MKALTLRQPFANMIARGEKTIETRTWSTKYRGRLAIHAARSKKRYLGLHPEPPYGAIVAVVTVVYCRPMKYADEAAACCMVYPDAQAWLLEDIVEVKPVYMPGAMGVFNIDLEEGDLEEAAP